MEEKKLTDEEIKKALECMAGITQRDCDKCPFLINKFCSDTKLSTATLDLIHRLQKENEELKSPKFASWKLKFFNLKDELKEERENMQAVIFGLEEDKRLLQKQVDELNERIEVREKEMFEVVKDCQRLTVEKEQAVKDTAKEISKKVVDLNVIYGDDFRLFLDNFELWVKERYGVEVE
jgi:hypothetical protein